MATNISKQRLGRKDDAKGGYFIRTFRRNGSAMQFYNIFCDGKAQAGPTGIRSPRLIETEKFLKNHIQLMGRNGCSMIADGNHDIISSFFCSHLDIRLRIAVGDSIF